MEKIILLVSLLLGNAAFAETTICGELEVHEIGPSCPGPICTQQVTLQYDIQQVDASGKSTTTPILVGANLQDPNPTDLFAQLSSDVGQNVCVTGTEENGYLSIVSLRLED